MVEFFGLLVKLFYLSLFIIFYALFNLFAFFGKKNAPGNDFIFVSVVCFLTSIPMLFGAYPLAIITWIVGLVLLFIGSKKNHEVNDESNPTFYFINVTIGAIIAVFMLLLFVR